MIREGDTAPGGMPYPTKFLAHQKAILLLLTLEEVADERFNQREYQIMHLVQTLIFATELDPTTPHPRSMGFVKKDIARDRWIISTVTNLLFLDAPKTSPSSVLLRDFKSASLFFSLSVVIVTQPRMQKRVLT